MSNDIKNECILDKRVIYFMAVVEEGSFSAAGRKYFMSQSGVSQQITLLEKDLEVRLFERGGYKPSLTECGKEFYASCAEIKKQCDALQMKLKTVKKNCIKIGITGFSENKQILGIINEFKNMHQELELSFVKGNLEEGIQNLIKHQVDFAFGLESDYKYAEEIEYKQLWPYKLYMICSFAHPLADRKEIHISRLKDEDFIVFSQDYGRGFYKDFLKTLKEDGIVPKIKKAVESIDELQFLVSIGEGIAIVSKDIIKGAEVCALEVKGSHLTSHYAIAYHNESFDNPLQKQFLDNVLDYYNKYKFSL